MYRRRLVTGRRWIFTPFWLGVDHGFALGPDGAVVAFGHTEAGLLADSWNARPDPDRANGLPP